MMHLVAETTALEAAWREYDTAVLRLQVSYANAGEHDQAARRARMELGMEVVRLWKRFREVFLATDEQTAAS